jgi:transketolase
MMKISSKQLQETPAAFDCGEIRASILELVCRGRGGHIGSSLSLVEILCTLYFRIMRINPDEPDDYDRDRLILSSAQGAVALYSVLNRRGFFRNDPMSGFLKKDSKFTMFPDAKCLPGVDYTSGSLGHGLSFGCGIACHAKKHARPFRTFVISGDGELNEGSNWEACLAASHLKLNNLVLIVNRNLMQIDGTTSQVMELEPLRAKFESFGWDVTDVDGHDCASLERALRNLRGAEKPLAIIARTVKGKGVSFMENNPSWHYRIPTEQERCAALAEIMEKRSCHPICDLIDAAP